MTEEKYDLYPQKRNSRSNWRRVFRGSETTRYVGATLTREGPKPYVHSKRPSVLPLTRPGTCSDKC